jgi:hypothetical protein
MYKNSTKIFCTPPGYAHKLLLIMKLTTLILITTLLQVSASTFGQRLTLRENKITLDKVFWQIREQTGYDVLLSTSALYNNRKIDVNFNNAPIDQVMDKIVQGTKLYYTIENKNVIIREKAPTFFDKVSAFLSSINVTGKIMKPANLYQR